jgi:copper/silver efflux system protein
MGHRHIQARQIVSEKLQMAAGNLPEQVEAPVMAPISSIMGEIMLVSVNSDRHSELDVRTAADWEIRRRLLAIPGVAQVIPIGGGKKQYQIRVHPDRLKEYNITLHQVYMQPKRQTKIFRAGFLITQPGVHHPGNRPRLCG